jgi:prolyl-tRNA synthetase
MNEIQLFLFHQAQNRISKQIVKVSDYEEFKKNIEEGKAAYAFWDGDSKVEDRIKEETKATIRCKPFKKANDKGTSLITNKDNSELCLFAKSY